MEIDTLYLHTPLGEDNPISQNPLGEHIPTTLWGTGFQPPKTLWDTVKKEPRTLWGTFSQDPLGESAQNPLGRQPPKGSWEYTVYLHRSLATCPTVEDNGGETGYTFPQGYGCVLPEPFGSVLPPRCQPIVLSMGT